MTADADMFVRFWGVRGSIACPGPPTVRFGGNTACVEARCGKHVLIFDGGTGMRPLGESLHGSGMHDFDVFYSHFHLEHVCGLPFFAPAYVAGNLLRLWGADLQGAHLEDVINAVVGPPLFPHSLSILKAKLEFRVFAQGQVLNPKGGIVLKTLPLNHPGGATGYRLEYRGRVVAYVTDTEHVEGRLDENVLKLAANADILIYDGTYTEAEYAAHAGWGHSTWQQGIAIANAASAGRLVIFHHDPGHDDPFMDDVARQAEAERPGSLVAREGLVLDLSKAGLCIPTDMQ